MAVQIDRTAPIDRQKTGTSGLRARTRVFMQPGYLENFVQSVFDAVGGHLPRVACRDFGA